jgi:HNH endonuclease
MAIRELPSPEVLRQLLRYEPDTGKLFWLPRTPDQFEPGYRHPEWNCRHWNSKYAGKEAFTASRPGGVNFRAHRVIWAIVYGVDPCDIIDHINGDPSDNRIENLRTATPRQNSQNRTKIRGSSKYLGVCYLASEGRWLMQMKTEAGRKVSRRFDVEIEAARYYDKIAAEHHGAFASLNFKTTP